MFFFASGPENNDTQSYPHLALQVSTLPCQLFPLKRPYGHAEQFLRKLPLERTLLTGFLKASPSTLALIPALAIFVVSQVWISYQIIRSTPMNCSDVINLSS